MERLAPRPAICPLWAFPAATRKEPEPNPLKRSSRFRPSTGFVSVSMGEVQEAGIILFELFLRRLCLVRG